MTNDLFHYGAARIFASSGVPANQAFFLLRELLWSVDSTQASNENAVKILIQAAYHQD